MTAIKKFYAGLTGAQKAKLWTLILSGMTIIAGSADKIVSIPGFPAWLATIWPAFVGVDIFVLKLISIFSNPNAVAAGAIPPPMEPPFPPKPPPFTGGQPVPSTLAPGARALPGQSILGPRTQLREGMSTGHENTNLGDQPPRSIDRTMGGWADEWPKGVHCWLASIGMMGLVGCAALTTVWRDASSDAASPAGQQLLADVTTAATNIGLDAASGNDVGAVLAGISGGVSGLRDYEGLPYTVSSATLKTAIAQGSGVQAVAAKVAPAVSALISSRAGQGVPLDALIEASAKGLDAAVAQKTQEAP
jgi:hypothetical protein